MIKFTGTVEVWGISCEVDVTCRPPAGVWTDNPSYIEANIIGMVDLTTDEQLSDRQIMSFIRTGPFMQLVHKRVERMAKEKMEYKQLINYSEPKRTSKPRPWVAIIASSLLWLAAAGLYVTVWGGL